MEFKIMIDQFEGPLDLMLHLIRENKLDLFDLDMNVLTEQYLAYLDAMESMHLVLGKRTLAASVNYLQNNSRMEYKSKKLLPREKAEITEEYEEDHRDRLVARLLEYQRFKEVSLMLKESFEHRQHRMDKPLSEESARWMNEPQEGELHCSPYDLVKAMKRVMQRMALMHPYETKMKVKEISVDERVSQIQERLSGWEGKMSFEQLCSDCEDLRMVIVTFLALLDLIKYKVLLFHIDEEETIWIIKGEDTYESAGSH